MATSTPPGGALRRAARLSSIPGVTLDQACRRCRVKKSALQRARKQLGRVWLQPTPELLLMAALTNNGARTRGRLSPSEPASIAQWIDFVNKDGCTAARIHEMLAALATAGALALDGDRWQLARPWPDDQD